MSDHGECGEEFRQSVATTVNPELNDAFSSLIEKVSGEVPG
jgi:hypothetical protein